jgi:hypothetical protein
MIDFPTFVDIDASTYRVQHTSSVIRSEFESGFSKQRQAYCSGFKRISFDIFVSGHKKQDFILWWESVGKGALWFNFIDPETLQISRARLIEFNLDFQPNDNQLRKWKTSLSLEIFNG